MDITALVDHKNFDSANFVISGKVSDIAPLLMAMVDESNLKSIEMEVNIPIPHDKIERLVEMMK